MVVGLDGWGCVAGQQSESDGPRAQTTLGIRHDSLMKRGFD
jgi:hypothetical protein